MKIGPRYKIARRLGANIYDKTQTAKFAARQAAKGEVKGKKKPRPKSEYGLQLLEKQKARFTYGMTEKQFSNYVKASLAGKGMPADAKLFEMLETRLDNVIYRLGLANSRAFARQLVSHGHITVNGQKVTIPSAHVVVGDKVSIREGSAKKTVFATATDKMKEATTPTWIKSDFAAKIADVTAMPKYTPGDALFDINAILEFYRRS